jgi:hypothetical protein
MKTPTTPRKTKTDAYFMCGFLLRFESIFLSLNSENVELVNITALPHHPWQLLTPW